MKVYILTEPSGCPSEPDASGDGVHILGVYEREQMAEAKRKELILNNNEFWDKEYAAYDDKWRNEYKIGYADSLEVEEHEVI